MKTKVSSDLFNIVEEKVANINNISNKKLKQHTKMIVQEFNMPFYAYGVSELNRFCHIHDSYSIQKYEYIMKKLKV